MFRVSVAELRSENEEITDIPARAIHHEVGLIAEGGHERRRGGQHDEKRDALQRLPLPFGSLGGDWKHKRGGSVVGDLS